MSNSASKGQCTLKRKIKLGTDTEEDREAFMSGPPRFGNQRKALARAKVHKRKSRRMQEKNFDEDS